MIPFSRKLLKKRIAHLTVFATLSLWVDLEAQIRLDGTLGKALSLQATVKAGGAQEYMIDSGLGQKVGQNLFHSFSDFNVGNGQIASFTGPADVRNILARVTGGRPSQIDGTLRSEINGADLYLLNPRGVVFGSTASLDVSGSFAVSTGDHISLGTKGRFDAGTPGNSILTCAAPSSFGFSKGPPAAIQINGSTLTVPDGKAIRLVGGDVIIGGDVSMEKGAQVQAPGGLIGITSVNSPGEVPVNTPISVSSFAKQGLVEISGNSLVSASPLTSGTGQIEIRGGRLLVDHSRLGTIEDSDGAAINIAVQNDIALDGATIASQTGRTAHEVKLSAQTILMQDQSQLVTDTEGSANGALFQIHADKLTLKDSTIHAVSDSGASGDGAQLEFNVARMTLEDSPFIRLQNNGSGKGATLHIVSTDFSFDGAGEFKGQITLRNQGPGSGGQFILESGSVSIRNGAAIRADADPNAPGLAGNISINASETLQIAGSSLNTSGQNGGSITLRAGSFLKFSDATVQASATDTGGNITIEKTPLVVLNHSLLDASATKGRGGNISVSSESFFNSESSLNIAGGEVSGQMDTPAVNVEIGTGLVPLKTAPLGEEVRRPEPVDWRSLDISGNTVVGRERSKEDRRYLRLELEKPGGSRR